MQATQNEIILSRQTVDQQQQIRKLQEDVDQAKHTATMQQLFATAARDNSSRAVEKQVAAEQKLAAALEENERLRSRISELEKNAKRESRPHRLIRRAYEYFQTLDEGFKFFLIYMAGLVGAVSLMFISMAISVIW